LFLLSQGASFEDVSVSHAKVRIAFPKSQDCFTIQY
jgi:hypothetical protein